MADKSQKNKDSKKKKKGDFQKSHKNTRRLLREHTAAVSNADRAKARKVSEQIEEARKKAQTS